MILMPGLRAALGCLVLVLIVGADAATVGPNAAARLERISSRVDADRVAVLIESSEPVAYVTSRPDPFTVLVDLRNVTMADLVNGLAESGPQPLAGVDVEAARAPDGSEMVRVRLTLVAPVAHHVRSFRGVIEVQLDHTRPLVSAATPVRTSAPAVLADAPPVVGPGRPAIREATRIRSIRTTNGSTEIRVVLTGDGALTPARIAEAEDPPPRLVLDFPGLSANVPAITTVNMGPVRRIRVAANSHHPLVTRVVFDLAHPSRYRVEQSGDRAQDLTVVFLASDVATFPDPVAALMEMEEVAPPAVSEPSEPSVQVVDVDEDPLPVESTANRAMLIEAVDPEPIESAPLPASPTVPVDPVPGAAVDGAGKRVSSTRPVRWTSRKYRKY